MDKIYDVIIIGGGPAGLSTALYAGRSKLSVLIIERGNIGGLITTSNDIENYPGSIIGDSGSSLTERMREQAVSFGAEIILDEIVSVDVSRKIKTIKGNISEYQCRCIVVASGGLPKTLGCKGELEHLGMGVSYCATCDGAFFNGLEVFVIGGGSSAVEEAIFLTRYARKVTIIHRRKEFRAEKLLVDQAQSNSKISFILDSVVEEIGGDGPTSKLKIRNVITNEITDIVADEKDGYFGVFIFSGYSPNSKLWDGILELSEGGYIRTDRDMKTNEEGIFAAGDVTEKTVRQVVTAVSDGSIAALSALKYLEG